MNTNELNKFDQLLKSKIENHKEAFNASDWAKLEAKLPTSTPKTFWTNPWLWSGAATIAIIATALFLYDGSNENKSVQEQPSGQDNISKEISAVEKENTNITIDEKEIIKNSIEVNDNNSIIPSIKEETKAENNINKTETTASNKPSTEINSTPPVSNEKGSKVDLSPSVTPEDFAKAVAVEKPVAHIGCKQTEQCINSKFSFESTTQKDVDYLWDFGDEKFSKEQNPTHKYTEPGSYKVSLIVRSKIDNTVLTKANEVLVNVLDAPNVNFELEEITTNGVPAHSFINTTDRANVWSWNLGDGNISSEKDPYHNYKRKGYYNVSLTAANEDGCSKTFSKKIYIENDYNLLAPNSFTPNGDGINDFFIPEALKVMDVEFSMSIYSQTDGLIFETKSNNSPWDGVNNQNGERCNYGNYIWIVTLTTPQGQTEQYKGAVLILE